MFLRLLLSANWLCELCSDKCCSKEYVRLTIYCPHHRPAMCLTIMVGVLRSNNIPAAPKYPSSSKSMVVPDLSAIHKALFTNK
ncbi:hypothetical protein J6590_069365 [Homalodisca vitripennis]|nr:hypothetical protein J6590_069365 [Homalodisca vitripennis]